MNTLDGREPVVPASGSDAQAPEPTPSDGSPVFTLKVFRDTRMDYSEWMVELYVGQGLSEAELVEYGGMPVFGEGETITEALNSLSQRWSEYVIEHAISALAASAKQAPEPAAAEKEGISINDPALSEHAKAIENSKSWPSGPKRRRTAEKKEGN